MKVSIITASYNNVDTIRSTIESVLSQTYPDIEYIVVDGGSADGTVDIIKEYQHFIAKWISEPDEGIYYALNRGLDMATGDVIGFLHADDVLCDYSTVSKIIDIFEKKQVDAVYGDLVYVARNDVHNIVRFWKSNDFTPQLLKQGWMPPHPTLFVLKKMYEKYGNFNTNLRIAADYDLILRFFSQPDFKSEYLPHIIVRMRMGGMSNKNIGNLFRKSQEDYKSMKFNNIGGLRALIWKNFSKLSQLKLFRKMKWTH
ncbi:MAG: glycosyltransferase [Bacteroidales bacterium]|jgi:glycosyltransferase|nr:glycosyltransferase [Bacteroidales bacterium]